MNCTSTGSDIQTIEELRSFLDKVPIAKCNEILFSRLFKTSYFNKPGYFGVIRYNLMCSKFFNKKLIPLGGIRLSNLNKLKIINCNSFAVLSEVKKKPAIISRLF